MPLHFERGVRLSQALSVLFIAAAVGAGLVGLAQVVLLVVAGAAPDLAWWVVALVCLALGVAARRSRWLVRLLAVQGVGAHRARQRVVWLLVLAMLLLIGGLKITSVDADAYKRFVFGEGGLVEWSQVVVLVAAIRTSWTIGTSLKTRLPVVWPSWIYRGLAFLLGVLLLEELAWGQVIFGWQTPESIRAINAQEETTFHNIGWFQDRLDVVTFLATVVILLVVVLLPRLARRLIRNCSGETRTVAMTLLPPAYFWPLFLFVVVIAYCVATRSFPDLIYNRDQEWGELVLYGSGLLVLLRTRVLLGSAVDRRSEV